jgi:hypothetical protein
MLLHWGTVPASAKGAEHAGSETWHVGIRVKTFVPEAVSCCTPGVDPGPEAGRYTSRCVVTWGSPLLRGSCSQWAVEVWVREGGPDGFPEVAEECVAPVVAECADDVQAPAGFGEGGWVVWAGGMRAGVGDDA